MKSNVKECLMFSSSRFYFRSFTVSGLIFKFLYAFWVNFCEWCEIWVQFHSFECGHSGFLTPFIEDSIISSMSIFNSLAKIGHVCVGLYLGSHSVPLVSVSVFIVHRPQFSWSVTCSDATKFVLGEITVWFRVVVWP